jgi:hypothetical protein
LSLSLWLLWLWAVCRRIRLRLLLPRLFGSIGSIPTIPSIDPALQRLPCCSSLVNVLLSYSQWLLPVVESRNFSSERQQTLPQ